MIKESSKNELPLKLDPIPLTSDHSEVQFAWPSGWSTHLKDILDLSFEIEENVVYKSKLISGIRKQLEANYRGDFDKLDGFQDFLIQLERSVGLNGVFELPRCKNVLERLITCISYVEELLEKNMIYSVAFRTEGEVLRYIFQLQTGLKWIHNRLYPTKNMIDLKSKDELKRVMDIIRINAARLSHVFNKKEDKILQHESLVELIDKLEMDQRIKLFDSKIDKSCYVSEVIDKSKKELLVAFISVFKREADNEEYHQKNETAAILIELIKYLPESIRIDLIERLFKLRLTMKEINAMKRNLQGGK